MYIILFFLILLNIKLPFLGQKKPVGICRQALFFNPENRYSDTSSIAVKYICPGTLPDIFLTPAAVGAADVYTVLIHQRVHA
jgi:hypothetical protein